MSTSSFNTTGKNPFNFFNQMKFPEVNYESIMESCHKNLDAITQVQQSILDATNVLAEMQTNFARHTIEETNNFIKNLMNAKSFEEKVKVQSEAVKNSVEKVFSHGRDVAQHWSQTQKDITDNMGQSMNENIETVKDALKKTASGKK